MTLDASPITVRPANEAAGRDLQDIVGARGPATDPSASGSSCGRASRSVGNPSRRAARIRERTNAGIPEVADTSGLVAYARETPVGWCAVEPRPHYCGLVRVFRVPWDGRDEDRTDATVWAVTCLLARAGYRRRGVSRALAAAVDHARRRDARAREAYPIDTEGTVSEDLHVGTRGAFADAGLVEVHGPSKRRRVMRIEFPEHDGDDRWTT